MTGNKPRDTVISPRNLPDTEERWQYEYAKILKKRLSQMTLKSSSGVTRDQYFALRAIRMVKDGRSLQDSSKLLSKQYIARARKHMESHDDFNRYIASLHDDSVALNDRPFHLKNCTFQLVRYSQLDVLFHESAKVSENVIVYERELRPRPVPNAKGKNACGVEDLDQSPFGRRGHVVDDDDDFLPPSALKHQTNDEQIVNAACINFCTSLAFSLEGLGLHWSIARKRFVFHIKGKTAENTYEARTDGYLQDFLGFIYAIIEVKPYLRHHSATTHWQETAEMVAWINRHGELLLKLKQHGWSPLLLSQDYNEFYLTFADFDESYVEYLNSGQDESQPFLYLVQYGPFRTDKALHMEDLSAVLLSLMLKLKDILTIMMHNGELNALMDHTKTKNLVKTKSKGKGRCADAVDEQQGYDTEPSYDDKVDEKCDDMEQPYDDDRLIPNDEDKTVASSLQKEVHGRGSVVGLPRREKDQAVSVSKSSETTSTSSTSKTRDQYNAKVSLGIRAQLEIITNKKTSTRSKQFNMAITTTKKDNKAFVLLYDERIDSPDLEIPIEPPGPNKLTITKKTGYNSSGGGGGGSSSSSSSSKSSSWHILIGAPKEGKSTKEASLVFRDKDVADTALQHLTGYTKDCDKKQGGERKR